MKMYHKHNLSLRSMSTKMLIYVDLRVHIFTVLLVVSLFGIKNQFGGSEEAAIWRTPVSPIRGWTSVTFKINTQSNPINLESGHDYIENALHASLVATTGKEIKSYYIIVLQIKSPPNTHCASFADCAGGSSHCDRGLGGLLDLLGNSREYLLVQWSRSLPLITKVPGSNPILLKQVVTGR